MHYLYAVCSAFAQAMNGSLVEHLEKCVYCVCEGVDCDVVLGSFSMAEWLGKKDTMPFCRIHNTDLVCMQYAFDRFSVVN